MGLRLGTAVGVVLASVLSARAADLEGWVPARWQGGPLEVARRARTNRPLLDLVQAGAIRDWYDPRTLDLLEGTPVNCLLVTWSTGAKSAVETEQHELLTPYVQAAHQRGIAVVGVVYPGADPERTAASAAEAGLDGLVIDGDFAGPPFARELRRLLRASKSSAVVIPLAARDWLVRDADWPVLGTSDGVAPRVRVFSESGGVTATPSSEPWIDSNTWLVRSLRTWGGTRPVWLGHALENPSEADYARAIADAAIAGGRWVVAPDDTLLAGLRHRDPGALESWGRIAGFLSFFEQQAEWSEFAPLARLGIIQDRAGKDVDRADEILNLITRRRIPYRVIERDALSAEALEDLQAVLATDLDPPTKTERKLLECFAGNGGLVIADPSQDPEALSRYVHDLLAGRLPVRLFNVASMLAHITGGRGGSPLLVQLVDYATEPSERITVRVPCDYQRARLLRPGSPPMDLKIDRSGEKAEVVIERVSVYAALLLQK